MKDHLDIQSRRDLVKYRLEKSDSALAEAVLMANNGFFDSAVTRLYYSCFYAASGLLIENEIETGSHRGVKTMLALNFVKKDLLDSKHLRTFSELLNGRQLSDYEDFFYQDKDSYNAYLEKTEEFIKAIRDLIKFRPEENQKKINVNEP